MSEKIELGWDGRKFVRGVFHDVDPPKQEPEPVKAAETKPKCWVTQTLIYVRYANPGSMQPPFGTSPQFWESRPDCVAWAKEKCNELNLPVIEIGRENPNLQARDFETPAIYVVCEKFDQFNDPSGRCFRY